MEVGVGHASARVQQGGKTKKGMIKSIGSRITKHQYQREYRLVIWGEGVTRTPLSKRGGWGKPGEDKWPSIKSVDGKKKRTGGIRGLPVCWAGTMNN